MGEEVGEEEEEEDKNRIRNALQLKRTIPRSHLGLESRHGTL